MLRSWRRSAVCNGLVLCLLVVWVLMGNGWAEKVQDEVSDPGLIRIDSMQAFGKLELPPVIFQHDRHTQTLAEGAESCTTCHPQFNGQFVFSFQELQASGKEAAKNLYHRECVSCHRSRKAKNLKTGPLEGACRSCHQEEAPALPDYASMGMDLALHAEHIQAQDDTCDACHHQYDQKAQKLVYTEGEELGCRACHKDSPVYPGLSTLVQAPSETLFRPQVSSEFLDRQEPMALSQAAHLSCLNCHLQEQQAADTSEEFEGPLSCQGCHDQRPKYAWEKDPDVPRLDRGQPDAALITAPAADVRAVMNRQDPAVQEPPLMQPVPFNHKAHEQTADTCRACHHQSQLESCGSCHDLLGSSDGDMITLSQAMHAENTSLSCVGCHAEQVRTRPECAGCHTFREAEAIYSEDTCHICHVPDGPDQMQAVKMTEESRAKAAASMVQRRSGPEQAELEEIPEEVTIKVLADQYGPVTFPHRQIAAKLQDNIADDGLAQAFHENRLTLCQGCHHNSKASQNPPSCASCHSQPFSDKDPGRPGLKAAYHGMCMDCHEQMQIDEPANTDCSSCHEQQRQRIITDGN